MTDPSLPDMDRLRPWLDRLATEPEGCVLVAITKSENQSLPVVGWCFLNAGERAKLKRGLKAINRVRVNNGTPTTREMP